MASIFSFNAFAGEEITSVEGVCSYKATFVRLVVAYMPTTPRSKMFNTIVEKSPVMAKEIGGKRMHKWIDFAYQFSAYSGDQTGDRVESEAYRVCLANS